MSLKGIFCERSDDNPFLHAAVLPPVQRKTLPPQKSLVAKRPKGNPVQNNSRLVALPEMCLRCATLSVAGHGLNDFDTQTGKRSADSEGRLEINCEVWRRSFVSSFLLDSQSKNGVLMVETFHPEIVYVIEFHRGESMLYRDVVSLLVNVVCHQPEMDFYR